MGRDVFSEASHGVLLNVGSVVGMQAWDEVLEPISDAPSPRARLRRDHLRDEALPQSRLRDYDLALVSSDWAEK